MNSGAATPTPAPTLPVTQWFMRTVAVQFDFRPNVGPSNPYIDLTGVISPTPITAPVASTPTFVGLTPGQVGLYQINLPLPSTFPTVLNLRFFARRGHFSRRLLDLVQLVEAGFDCCQDSHEDDASCIGDVITVGTRHFLNKSVRTQ